MNGEPRTEGQTERRTDGQGEDQTERQIEGRAGSDARSQTAVSPKPASGRRRWPWIGLVLLCVLAAGVYRFLGPGSPLRSSAGNQAAAARAMPVIAATARRTDVDVYLDGLGTVTPLATVTVHARVDGQLNRVLFQEGQHVESGQLLAEIDPRPFQAQVLQMQGQLARDQALLANAQLDLRRYRTLYAQDSISQQQLTAQESLVQQDDGTVKSDQGQLDSARLQLVYTRITAPVSGRVGLRLVDPGNLVQTTDANGLLVITQLQPITVVFTLPEDSLPAVMKRLRAGATLPAQAFNRDQTMQLATGSLLAVDNQIDTTTGTVRLKAQFPNADEALFPNQFVVVRLRVDVRHDTVVIPAAAIQRGAQGNFVYLVAADHTVSVRTVKTGPAQGDDVAIDSGIEAGEQVVVDGADKLHTGARVTLPAQAQAQGNR